MLSNATIFLFNTDIVQNDINGESDRVVNSFKKILGELNSVGANTFWNAHSNQVELVATVQIQAVAFKNQKFVYLKRNGQGYVYEVNNVAKGESFEKIRLNLSESKEVGLKELIESAISRN